MFHKSLSLKLLFIKQDEALTNIHVVIQWQRNDSYHDIAPGEGGKLRYLKMLKDDFSYTRIGRVGLLRSPRNSWIFGDRKKHGWDECTGDINEDRTGAFYTKNPDWLHLCWNTVSTAYVF